MTPSQKATIATEMLPLIEQEAAARRAATQRKEAGPGRGRVEDNPKSRGPFNPDRNERKAAAEAAKQTGTDRQRHRTLRYFSSPGSATRGSSRFSVEGSSVTTREVLCERSQVLRKNRVAKIRDFQ